LEPAENGIAAKNPTLDCVGAEPDLPGVAPQFKLAQTTYCMTRGNHLLRIIERPDWIVALNDVKPFDNKYIARSIELSRHGAVYLRLHVEELSAASDFKVLDMTPPETAQRIPFHRADLSPGQSTQIVHGQPLSESAPMMPPLGHEGKVSLKIHIDTTGAVDSAVVTSSDNKFLDGAAILAVKQWHYRVSYQGEHVVAVDDVVTLNFQQKH
jgi:TonB family protein